MHAAEDATLYAELRARVPELLEGLDAHLAVELAAIRALAARSRRGRHVRRAARERLDRIERWLRAHR